MRQDLVEVLVGLYGHVLQTAMESSSPNNTYQDSGSSHRATKTRLTSPPADAETRFDASSSVGSGTETRTESGSFHREGRSFGGASGGGVRRGGQSFRQRRARGASDDSEIHRKALGLVELAEEEGGRTFPDIYFKQHLRAMHEYLGHTSQQHASTVLADEVSWKLTLPPTLTKMHSGGTPDVSRRKQLLRGTSRLVDMRDLV
mmetsp:Transcript_57009/g.127284  ORF Transcript_57009/g.127284 Transcript_57009/m.127284 type:complete len:203 (-) Transcript_57009:129-737(-)